MMIVRELAGGCRAADVFRDRRLPSIVEYNAEAAVVGIAEALGPLDTLTASAGPPPAGGLSQPGRESRSAPLTIWLNEQASQDIRQCLSALFVVLHDSPSPEAEDVAVDGGDVEAVLVAARHAAYLARGHVTQLLHLLNDGPQGPRDPIAALSGRLLRDRQLDHNALGAISRDARRVAAGLSATGLRPTTGRGGTPVPHELRAGAPFLQDFAGYVRQLTPAASLVSGITDPVRR
ncbi:hypothetical protein Q0Z83_042080 [Actinoplanes sichuanensis]|nr:hypothetical protein Q0Z83_042080 [Actinoplanes sichuanensis]